MNAVRGLTGWFGTVLSSREPAVLAGFYRDLLGWEITGGSPDFVTMLVPGTTTYLAFARDDSYEPPVWPSEHGRQGQQMHLDVGVADLGVAVADALALGARMAAYQPQDDVRVLLDPDGHPFCLYLDG